MVRGEYRHGLLRGLSPTAPGPAEELDVPRSEAPLRSGSFKPGILPSEPEPERPRMAQDRPESPGCDGACERALPSSLLQPCRRAWHRRPCGLLGFRLLPSLAHSIPGLAGRALQNAG